MRVLRFFIGSLLLVLVSGIASPQTKAPTTSALTPYQTGLAAFKHADLPDARTSFEKAVKLNPRDPDAQNMLAQVLLQQGDVDNAIVHLRLLVKLRPTLAIAHAYLAQALQTRGRIDEAVTEFRIAVPFAPNQWRAPPPPGRAPYLPQQKESTLP